METAIDLPVDLRVRAQRAAAARGLTLARFVRNAIEVAVSADAVDQAGEPEDVATVAPTGQPTDYPPGVARLLVDPEELRAGFDALFASLGIEGEPQGVLALQEEMRRAGLENLGLSQAIVDMREE